MPGLSAAARGGCVLSGAKARRRVTGMSKLISEQPRLLTSEDVAESVRSYRVLPELDRQTFPRRTRDDRFEATIRCEVHFDSDELRAFMEESQRESMKHVRQIFAAVNEQLEIALLKILNHRGRMIGEFDGIARYTDTDTGATGIMVDDVRACVVTAEYKREGDRYVCEVGTRWLPPYEHLQERTDG